MLHVLMGRIHERQCMRHPRSVAPSEVADIIIPLTSISQYGNFFLCA